MALAVSAKRLIDTDMSNNKDSDGSLPNLSSDNFGSNEATAHETNGTGRTQIGPYKILQKIAEGGMGVVYMAQQDKPIKRRVALKLVKAGCDPEQIIARFDAERQALAMMDHANIARIFDAGTTDDGLPYFVMELVKGIPLTEYCDNNKLSIRERLELFVPVCKAIQHAHTKGIIHRDLKPSNVLVALYDGVPVPKVIDFGLAKATEHQLALTDKTMFTEFGQVVGTVQYMSPEQAEMNQLDIDTRTDVYSLGVMLYELLTGSTPLEKQTMKEQALLKVLELIREIEPPRPSTRLSDSGDAISGVSDQRKIEPSHLQKILRGELDWIVMKSLEKDRRRRYETPNDFAQDISNFLNDDAVTARPPSRTYRLQKLIRKNRGLFAALAAVAFAMFVGICTTTWFWMESSQNAKFASENAERERLAKNEAVIERNDAKTKSKRLSDVLSIVTGAFKSTNPSRGGTSAMKARQVLLNAEKELAKSELDGRGRAMLFDTLTNSFHGLGEFAAARRTAHESLIVLEADLDPSDEELWKARQLFGKALHYAGENDEAIETLESCRDFWEQRLGEKSDEALESLRLIAIAYLAAERWDDAETTFQFVLDRQEGQLGKNDRATIISMNNLAVAMQHAGRLKEALPIYEKTLIAMQQITDADDPALLQFMYNVAQAYEQTGKVDESIELFEKVIERRVTKIGIEHPWTVATMWVLGKILNDSERFEEAEKHLRLALENTKINSALEWETYQTQSALGESLAGLGRDEEALKYLEEAMSGMQQYPKELSSPAKTEMLLAVDRLIKFAESHEDLTQLRKWKRLKQEIQNESENAR